MNKTIRNVFLAAICLAAFAFFGPQLIKAADTAAPPVAAPTLAVPGAPTTGNAAADSILTWLTPLVVPLIIAAKKKFFPSIPSWLLPILAPLLGVLLDVINTYALGHQSNVLLAALLGLAGVGVREVKDQLVPARTQQA